MKSYASELIVGLKCKIVSIDTEKCGKWGKKERTDGAHGKL